MIEIELEGSDYRYLQEERCATDICKNIKFITWDKL